MMRSRYRSGSKKGGLTNYSKSRGIEQNAEEIISDSRLVDSNVRGNSFWGWMGQSTADEQGTLRWWYDLDGGNYYAGTDQAPQWQWIDGNREGIAECYAFDSCGWIYTDTITPDGYQVNADGAWTVNNHIQTIAVEPGYGGNGQIGETQSAEGSVQNTNTDEDILIVYFSRTGNTARAARLIQAQIGGDIFEIQPSESYPESYSATTQRAQREISAGALPAIEEDVENLTDYEIIFVGYPIWWDTTPPVVNTFLSGHNFAGKTMIPFCTSGGSGIQGSLSNINRYCAGANILSGRDLGGADEAEIQQWLASIGVAK